MFLESITPREILEAWKPTLKYCMNPARKEGTKIKSLSKRKNIRTIKTATIKETTWLSNRLLAKVPIEAYSAPTKNKPR